MGQAKNRGTFEQRQAHAVEKKASRLAHLREQFDKFQKGLTDEQLEQSLKIRTLIAASLGVEVFGGAGKNAVLMDSATEAAINGATVYVEKAEA